MYDRRVDSFIACLKRVILSDFNNDANNAKINREANFPSKRTPADTGIYANNINVTDRDTL